jgi:hypothetical protein
MSLATRFSTARLCPDCSKSEKAGATVEAPRADGHAIFYPSVGRRPNDRQDRSPSHANASFACDHDVYRCAIGDELGRARRAIGQVREENLWVSFVSRYDFCIHFM